MPLLLVLAAVGWAGWGYISKVRAEAVATDFMTRVRVAQQSFSGVEGGFAAGLDSLTTPCPSGPAPWLESTALQSLTAAGYGVQLRPRAGARELGQDCHGRPLVDDYYVGVQPISTRAAGQRAYGSTSAGRIFVFVDGIAPAEADMGPGGLAIPLPDMATFRIP